MTQTTNKDNPPEGFYGHLAELRVRLIYSVFFIGVAFCICWYFSSDLFDFIRKPISPYLEQSNGGLVFTGVMDKFTAHVKVSFLASLILSCPFWIFQIWKFIAPGLHPHERKYGAAFIISAILLFVGGTTFVYYFAFPATFAFLLNFGGSVDKPLITINDYVSFFVTTTMAFGFVFELPLVIVLLGAFGIVTPKFLREKRKYAIVLLSIVAAIITPTPDALTMLMMMVPLIALYEIAVFIVSYFDKKRMAATPEA